MPIEYFIIDPPMLWTQGPFRGVQFIKRSDEITDMIMWVGAEHYPFPSDFIEEGRAHGFSKRVPLNADADYSVLTPMQSRIILVHPRAYMREGYKLREGKNDPATVPTLDRPSDMTHCDCDHAAKHIGNALTPCTFATWDLSALHSTKGHVVTYDDDDATTAHIVTPSVEYDVHVPISPKEESGKCITDALCAAVFLALPWSHFEYVSESNTMPQIIADKLGNNVNVTAVTNT